MPLHTPPPPPPTPPPASSGMSAATVSSTRSTGGTVRASAPLLGWRTIDLVTAAMLGVAFGVIFWGWDILYKGPLELVFVAFKPSSGLVAGVWLIPAVVGGLVVRRPGAALLAEMVAANVEMLLGNAWGPAVLLSGLLQALGVEMVLAVFLWRRFGPTTAALAGALSAVLEVVVYEWWSYWVDWSWAYKFVYLGAFIVSGALVAGLGGWAITRALARAGALSAFPPGQEERERHAV